MAEAIRKNAKPGVVHAAKSLLLENSRHRDLISVLPPDTSSTASQITIPIEEYIALLAEVKKAEQVTASPAPTAFVVSSLDMTGVAEADGNVRMEVAATIRYLDDPSRPPWRSIPLLEGLTIVSASLKRNGALVDLSRPLQVTPEGTPVEHGEAGILGMHSGYLTLFMRLPGVYQVAVTVLVRATVTSHNSTMCLNHFPSATQTSLHFTVPRKDMTIQVAPALSHTVVATGDAPRSIVKVLMPPCTRATISWTVREPEPEEEVVRAEIAAGKEEEKPTVITVEHQTLASLGEGILTAVCQFTYDITGTNGSSVFDICLGDGFDVVRILSIKGGRSMKRWEIVDRESVDGVVSPKGARQKVLHVLLQFPASGTYTLEFVAEMETPTSNNVADVRIPNWNCLGAARERGFVGVCARTTVEIEQINCQGRAITKVDVRELPERLGTIAGANNPLLLGYKYLHAAFNLTLRVTKHADVNVLVAVMDNCMVDATYTEEGKILYHVRMNIRNKGQQYLRMSLGSGAEVWTTLVKGQPVKPAQDTGDHVMIATPKTGDELLVAEIIFLRRADPMTSRGTIEIPLPQFDIPITVFVARVFLPDATDYLYDEPTGLEKLTHFANQEYSFQTYSAPAMQPAAPRMPQQAQVSNVRRHGRAGAARGGGRPGGRIAAPVQDRHNVGRGLRRHSPVLRREMMDLDMGNVEMEQEDGSVGSEEDSVSDRAASVMMARHDSRSMSGSDDEKKADDGDRTVLDDGAGAETRGMAAGVIPIQIIPPKVGNMISFERMLVATNEDVFTIEVPYREMPRTCIAKCMVCC